MPETEGLDIQKVIEQSATRTTLSDLARRGVQRVKVLDERAILNLIRQAVDKVLSARGGLLAEEERAKITTDSRRELDKLMREAREMKSRAELLEAGKSDLVLQVENLQKQLQLQRHLEAQNTQRKVEAETAALQARVHELEGGLEAGQKELKKLREQVGRLMGEQGALNTQLEEAKAELERVRKQDAQAQKQTLETKVREIEGRLKASQDAESAAQQALQALRGEHNRALADQIDLRKSLEKARQEGGVAQQGEVTRLQQRLSDEEARARDASTRLAAEEARSRDALSRLAVEEAKAREAMAKLSDEEARHREALAKISTSSDLDKKLAALEANIEKKFQAVQETSLASKLDELGETNKELRGQLEKMFARMTDTVTKKLSGMRGVAVGAAGGGEDADFRPGERMLESLFKQELESNLPSITPTATQEAKPGSMSDALAKLKKMQGGLGGGGGATPPPEKK
jgi:chromosome segregation ATPase